MQRLTELKFAIRRAPSHTVLILLNYSFHPIRHKLSVTHSNHCSNVINRFTKRNYNNKTNGS